jgi:hypothetical protein
MKQRYNIILFFVILSIPFALSSQTRKAIPAGRYESLSGIKVSHTTKVEGTVVAPSDTQVSIWQEVLKNLPTEKDKILYFKSLSRELSVSNLLPLKTLQEIKQVDQNFDLLISENLKNDKELIKHLNPHSIVVLVSAVNLKDTLLNIAQFDLLIYQSQGKENYYLLKLK